jgi:Uma2 family endonuclease
MNMVAVTHISLEEFHARYAHESGYEYWFGEVVHKSVPTWLHAILQSLLAEIFYEQGYFHWFFNSSKLFSESPRSR